MMWITNASHQILKNPPPGFSFEVEVGSGLPALIVIRPSGRMLRIVHTSIQAAKNEAIQLAESIRFIQQVHQSD